MRGAFGQEYWAGRVYDTGFDVCCFREGLHQDARVRIYHLIVMIDGGNFLVPLLRTCFRGTNDYGRDINSKREATPFLDSARFKFVKFCIRNIILQI